MKNNECKWCGEQSERIFCSEQCSMTYKLNGKNCYGRWNKIDRALLPEKKKAKFQVKKGDLG